MVETKKYEYNDEERHLCMIEFLKTPAGKWEGEQAWKDKRRAKHEAKLSCERATAEYLNGGGGPWF